MADASAGSGDLSAQARDLIAAADAHQARAENEAALKVAREALLLFRRAGDAEGVVLARDRCASLRKQAPPMRLPASVSAPGPARASPQCVPAITGPGTMQHEPYTSCYRVCGSAETRRLAGLVTLVTGASRGLGKGISQMLAEAGAVVYVTGRSAPGKVSDPLVGGTVDETAASFAKLGGTGVAAHVDHAQEAQNRALVDMVVQNHGRLDVLVNNAFYLPSPAPAFFHAPLWSQPSRFLNEQVAVGGLNHVAQTLMFAPALRRGKGLVINVSSPGAQHNMPGFPASYACNKAAFDRSSAALSEQLRPYNIHVLTLWPGPTKSERTVLWEKSQSGVAKLVDLETTRFTGQAVVQLASLKPDALAHFSSSCKTIASADVARFELDGFMQEAGLQTFATGGRRVLR